MIEYLVNVACALSQLINAAVFLGDPNETVSGRCWREQRRWAYKTIDLLFFFQPNHCLHSHLADRVFARKVLNQYKERP